MANAPAQARSNYLETFHQPHLSIYFPIIGYWKERSVVTGVKKEILDIVKVVNAIQIPALGDIRPQQTRPAREIVNMLTIINKYKRQGETRDMITIACCIPLYFLGLAWSSAALVVGAIFLAMFHLLSLIHHSNQRDSNQDLIRDINQKLGENRFVDFDGVALKMT